jgi:hypothetical protein
MNLADSAAHLQRFQEYGDTKSIVEYIRLTGKDSARYKIALQILTPVFDPLGHGEYPRYRDLDRQRLRDYETEVRFIASCMAGSEKADLQGSAAQLLDLLDRTDR